MNGHSAAGTQGEQVRSEIRRLRQSRGGGGGGGGGRDNVTGGEKLLRRRRQPSAPIPLECSLTAAEGTTVADVAQAGQATTPLRRPAGLDRMGGTVRQLLSPRRGSLFDTKAKVDRVGAQERRIARASRRLERAAKRAERSLVRDSRDDLLGI